MRFKNSVYMTCSLNIFAKQMRGSLPGNHQHKNSLTWWLPGLPPRVGAALTAQHFHVLQSWKWITHIWIDLFLAVPRWCLCKNQGPALYLVTHDQSAAKYPWPPHRSRHNSYFGNCFHHRKGPVYIWMPYFSCVILNRWYLMEPKTIVILKNNFKAAAKLYQFG